MEKKFFRINQHIRAIQVRVIGEDGKQIGILNLDQAIAKAREAGMDLIEIAPTAKPPVAKIADYKKFLYTEEKKARKSKSKGGEIKEVRFTPFIAKADFEVRINKIKDFLQDGNKVKVVVKFVGRQLTKKDFGYEIINKIKYQLSGIGEFEGDPKWMGPNLSIIVNFDKKNKAISENENKQTKNTKISIEPN